MNAKSLLLPLVLFAAVSCRETAPVYKNADAPVDKRVEDLLSRMTQEEKILQLSQYHYGGRDNKNNIPDQFGEDPKTVGSVIYSAPDEALARELQELAVGQTRLGIPILFGYDVIHGFRTIFPIPLGQAATFEPALSTRAATVAAKEAAAGGVRWTFSPMVDIARDPRWGRIAEGYGEDPYLASRFSEATVKGYQWDDLSNPSVVAACLKHYVGYGASEAGRDYVYTEISRQTLWDTYLPPFKAGVDAGCPTAMSAFNDISGTPATANPYTLTEILKNRWGLDGFVVSDWQGVRQLVNQGRAASQKEAAALAFNAGVEMDMMDNVYVEHMPALIEEGAVKMKDIDNAVRRVLGLKFRLGLFEHPFPAEGEFLGQESLALSKEAAVKSFVLLKNEGILPLKAARVALIGPIADDHHQILGSWRAHGADADAVSIKDALEQESCSVFYSAGCGFEDGADYAPAVAAARRADVVVLCLGEESDWSGESASRADIVLPAVQIELLEALHKTGKKIVTVLSAGRPLDLRAIEPLSDAILFIWQPGTMTGPAVADVLTGRVSPSGKLPVSFPRTVGQIPIHYNRRNPAREGRMGRYQDLSSDPMYPFGYGLSYATFAYSPVTVEGLTATVTVTNTSAVDADETVLWYLSDLAASITRPAKELKFFEKKRIPAGESVVFRFEMDPERDFSFPDFDGNRILERGEFAIQASTSDPVTFVY